MSENSPSYSITIEEQQHKLRLDKALQLLLPSFSRSRIQDLILSGHVKHGTTTITQPKYKVSLHDVYDITIPPATPTHMEATDIPLDIIHEDEDLLVINKQAGLSVHPGAGDQHATMVNALLHHCQGNLSGVGGVLRPGIVHRIDKDTTGLLVVAKNDNTHHFLSQAIQDRHVKRQYLALCWGKLSPKSGTIHTQIGRHPKDRKRMTVLKHNGKEAITHYHTQKLLHQGTVSVVECTLDTGRTHQIRVHMSHFGHAIIGDQKYGKVHTKYINRLPDNIKETFQHFKRQALHAYQLSFPHPRSGEILTFTAPWPDDVLPLLDDVK